ncbi:ABC transporter substrate-binding protein [Paracoccus laeviglucosivorans]|uniref:Iron(III) transport system substrate-binding protein n=1 Tax=Paracoccus laeviglucosivorans TaxID=1197861 RepID=A0A521BD35_9RHOB|nr:ABC transporter substrate-binding protein [Paracoccus laeviglucosivorans]SMO44983.1 iron(III) transport system substrate-binding protein [Paracoccus laeviglucosivorans]
MFKPLYIASALALLAGTASAETLTVYTSQPQDQMTQVIEAFRKDHPEIQVELFRSGTTEVLAKLQAEFAAGNSPADVLLIADAVAMTKLKNENRLMPFPEAKVDGIDPALIDADKTFFATKLITTGIVYNTDNVKQPPKSWADLATPEIASQTIMPSPLYSGAAVIHVGTMEQQPEFGAAYMEKLADGGAVAGQGNGTVLEAVARGEKSYGVLVEYMAMNAKAKGSPVDFVFPSEGVTAVTQPVAIVAGTNVPDAAKAFIDWQLSKAAQEQSVAQGYFPLLADVKAPAGYPEVASVKVMPADNAKLLADDKAIKEGFADLFGG